MPADDSATAPPDPTGIAADPIALEILWSRLIAAADEAATTLVRTAFSPIVTESNDFACAIFDAEGNVIAENTIGIPSFNMTMAVTLSAMLRDWRPRDAWRPGDVAFTNDPWISSGHLPDVTVIAPVFRDGRLFGWTGNIAHQADIGGALWSADTRSVYEEGVRIPPSLLVDAGEVNAELLRVLRANLRMPDEVEGDLMAQIAAARTAAQRLAELADEMGLDTLDHVSEAICRRSEQSMRQAVARIPDGVYESHHDLDGTDDEPVRLQVAVTVSGDSLHVDYTGTSPEVSKALNVVTPYTQAYTSYPLKCLLDPHTPRSEGSYRCIEVTAPEGSILNPRYPAPVNARQLVGHCLAAVLYKALSPVLPDRVIAESGSAPSLRTVISGPRDTQGRQFTSIFFVNGGMGARPTKDGLAATCYPSMVICGSMETLEATAPIRVARKELIEDSGGAGTYRGGLGQHLVLKLLAPGPCTLSLFVEHTRNRPEGMRGGGPGSASRVAVNGRTDGFPLKGRSRIQPGDEISIHYPGGGGFGPPLERDRDAVRADLAAGLISDQAAREVYGLR